MSARASKRAGVPVAVVGEIPLPAWMERPLRDLFAESRTADDVEHGPVGYAERVLREMNDVIVRELGHDVPAGLLERLATSPADASRVADLHARGFGDAPPKTWLERVVRRIADAFTEREGVEGLREGVATAALVRAVTDALDIKIARSPALRVPVAVRALLERELGRDPAAGEPAPTIARLEAIIRRHRLERVAARFVEARRGKPSLDRFIASLLSTYGDGQRIREPSDARIAVDLLAKRLSLTFSESEPVDAKALVAEASPALQRPYRPSERYLTGEVINHPKFGVGVIVTAEAGTITAAFGDGPRKLVHGI